MRAEALPLTHAMLDHRLTRATLDHAPLASRDHQ